MGSTAGTGGLMLDKPRTSWLVPDVAPPQFFRTRPAGRWLWWSLAPCTN